MASNFSFIFIRHGATKMNNTVDKWPGQIIVADRGPLECKDAEKLTGIRQQKHVSGIPETCS